MKGIKFLGKDNWWGPAGKTGPCGPCTEIFADDVYLGRVAREGAEKARESARKTINDVREIIGFKQFG